MNNNNTYVGEFYQTNDQIKEQDFSDKKTIINNEAQSKIFKLLGVDNERDALIAQANAQGAASNIIANVALNNDVSNRKKIKLASYGKLQNEIKNILRKAKKEKKALADD
jgi:hypothetical protein